MGKKQKKTTEELMNEFFKEQEIEEERFTRFFEAKSSRKVLNESYVEVADTVTKEFFEQRAKRRFKEMIYIKLLCLVELAKKGVMPPEWAEETCEKILSQNPRTFSQDLADACEYVKEVFELKS